MTPELWESSGMLRPVEEIAAELNPYLENLDGISISGGEPFDQAEGLAALVRLLRSQRDCEVLIYTGYVLNELQQQGGAVAELLAMTDILIDGPFEVDTANTLQWRGSDNQCVHLLSPRAQRYAAIIDQPMPDIRPLSLQQLAPGRYRLIGIPHRGDMERYRQALASRGIEVSSPHE